MTEQPVRHTVDTITRDALDALYETLDAAEQTSLARQLATADKAFIAAHLRATRNGAALDRTRRALASTILQARRQAARAEQAEAELAALHAGEEPHPEAANIANPAQWIWCWNRATPEQRLDMAGRIQHAFATAEACLFMNHKNDTSRRQAAGDAIARVRARHRLVNHRGRSICAECSAYDGQTTDNPPLRWPCPTIAALDEPKEHRP